MTWSYLWYYMVLIYQPLKDGRLSWPGSARIQGDLLVLHPQGIKPRSLAWQHNGLPTVTAVLYNDLYKDMKTSFPFCILSQISKVANHQLVFPQRYIRFYKSKKVDLHYHLHKPIKFMVAFHQKLLSKKKLIYFSFLQQLLYQEFIIQIGKY